MKTPNYLISGLPQGKYVDVNIAHAGFMEFCGGFMFEGKHLKIVAVMVLFFGLGSAIAIYLTAGSATEDLFNPMTSKAYMRELQLYGGKFNVLAAKLSQWFGNLWHGKPLAFIIGGTSLFMAGLLWFAPVSRQTDHSENGQ